MSWGAVVVGAVSLGSKLIAKGAAKRKAKKARKKAQAEIAAKEKKEKEEIAQGYATQEMKEKDLENVYEGATSIDPEAAQAREDNERATASAIEKAQRTGASSGEIMNMVAGLTGQGQRRAKGISAETHSRRQEALVAAKQQGVRAAQVGLAGKEAQIAIGDKNFSLMEMKNAQINQAAAMDYQATSDMINDAAGIAMGGISAFNASKYGGMGGAGVSYMPPPEAPKYDLSTAASKGKINQNRRTYNKMPDYSDFGN